MPGIPSHLLTSLRNTLADCDPFETNRSLRNLFADVRLVPWRNSVPQANGISERVDNVVSYLHDKKHRDGSNALVSLLLVLAEATPPGDDRGDQLRSLADQLGLAIPSAVNTGSAQKKAPAAPTREVQSVPSTAGAKPQTALAGKRFLYQL